MSKNNKVDTIIVGCENYPDKKESLKKFGQAIKAIMINYEDLGKGERYKISLKNGTSFILIANGNQYDGGFITFKEED